MAENNYLGGHCGPLTRAVGRLLSSARLVSSTGPSPDGGVTMADLLAEARRSILPLMLIGTASAPQWVRVLALRQYVLVVAISVGLFAAEFATAFGLMWLTMHFYQGTIPGAFDLSSGTDRVAAAIALGCSLLFGKISLLCVALTILFQPTRAPE